MTRSFSPTTFDHSEDLMQALWVCGWAFVLVMVFACGLPCEKSFTNQRGLSNHKNGCPIYRRAEMLAVAQRQKRIANTKAQRAKQMAPVMAPVSSVPAVDMSDVCPFQ
jgi:hypothetical protein